MMVNSGKATLRHGPSAPKSRRATPALDESTIRYIPMGKADRYIYLLFVLILTTIFFEGVIRWALGLVGLGSLIYLRDVVEVGIILFVLLRSLLAHGWVERHVAIPLLLLVVHFFASLWLGVSFLSDLFSFKLYVPFLCGAALWGVFYNRFEQSKKLFALIFVASILAIFFNVVFKKMPWEGQLYDTFFGQINSTVDWTAGDAGRRLPGFTRASYVAAMVICITGLTWLLDARKWWLRLLILASGAVAIYLTTTKTLTLIFPLIGLWLLIPGERMRVMVGKWLLVTCAALCILLPLLAYALDFAGWSTYQETPTIMLSFWDRLSRTWPEAWDLLSSTQNYIFGSGMGSIGTGQVFGDNARHWNAGDNIAIYLFITFGLPGLFYLLLPAWFLFRRVRYPMDTYFWIFSILLVAYGYGITSNMIEEQFFCEMLGLVFGAVLYEEWRPEFRRRGPRRSGHPV